MNAREMRKKHLRELLFMANNKNKTDNITEEKDVIDDEQNENNPMRMIFDTSTDTLSTSSSTNNCKYRMKYIKNNIT